MNVNEPSTPVTSRLVYVNHGQVINALPQQKRNDLCACGSGKKFKKCCIAGKVHNPPRRKEKVDAEDRVSD